MQQGALICYKHSNTDPWEVLFTHFVASPITHLNSLPNPLKASNPVCIESSISTTSTFEVLFVLLLRATISVWSDFIVILRNAAGINQRKIIP